MFDSRALWDRLQNTNRNSCDSHTAEAARIIHQLAIDHQVSIIWVPGHAGLTRNELADQAAREGSALPQPLTQLSYQAATAQLRRHLETSERSRYLEEVPADNLHRRISGGDPLPPSGARSRKEDVLLHRLRANRAPFLQATLHRWGKAPSPSCPHCGAPQEDTEHFVLHCPHWADIRRTHLGAPDIIDVTILQNEESGVLRFVEAAGH